MSFNLDQNGLLPTATGLSQNNLPFNSASDPAFAERAAASLRALQEQNARRESARKEGATQGIFGDMADAAQRGVAQTAGGDLETLGQLTDWQGAKNLGRAVSDWGDSQLDQMSEAGRGALEKPWYVENEDGSISAGEALTDWRAWVLQGATLAGQVGAMVLGTKGAGFFAKPVAAKAAKTFAKDKVGRTAQEMVTKDAVKAALKDKGSLDDIRAAMLTAGSKEALDAAAKRTVAKLGFIGYGAHSAAMAGGLRAQQAQEEAASYWRDTPYDQIAQDPKYQEEYWRLADGEMQGSEPGEIYKVATKNLSERAATDAWANPVAMAADFAAGSFEGAFAGIGGLAGKIGKTSTRKGAAAKGFVTESTFEGTQAGTTQWAVNEAIREYADETRDPYAGVLVQALTEATIAGPMGGAAGAISGPNRGADGGKAKITQTSYGEFDSAARWATKMADALDLHKGNLTPEQAHNMVRKSMINRGATDAFAEIVAERTVLTMKGSAPRFTAPAWDSEVQRSLANGSGQSVEDMVAAQMEAGDQGKSLYERTQAGELGVDPFAGGKSAQQVAMENQRPALPAPTEQDMEIDFYRREAEKKQDEAVAQRDALRDATFDPGVESGFAAEASTNARDQAIQQAGSATDSVFGPLKTLRITKRGKPFATEKEAAVASRKGKEMAVPLNGGGFGVAEIAEVEQVMEQGVADGGNQQANAGDLSANAGDLVPDAENMVTEQPASESNPDVGQPSDQPAASVSAETVPAPSAKAGEASTNQETGTEPAAEPTPWAEAIDNPDGTITLKGDVPLIKQWAKDNGVKAIPGKGGLLVATSSAAKVREFAKPAASEPAQQVEAARAEVEPEPTEAQKEAGNYKKGHLKLQGLDIALENPKGSTRSGTDSDGKAWQSTMAHDYGYIKRTTGADGDHVDVFIGDQPDSETVYVVDQVDPKTGKFDEHKVMMGFANEQAARDGYLANYEKGWKGLGAIKAMPIEAFKRWLSDGDTTKPVVAGKAEPQSKIADFGEKIGGARKDAWAAYRDTVEGDTAEQIKGLPLSKAWPAPDYDKLIESGVDRQAVAIARSARDAIPAKPRSSHKVNGWAEAVKHMRDMALGLLDGSLDVDKARRAMLSSNLRSSHAVMNRAELYQAVGHQRSLADLELSSGSYSLYDGIKYDPPKSIWTISRESKSSTFGNWPRTIAAGSSKAEVISEFKRHYEQLTSQESKPKAVSFDIYSTDNRRSWIVGKKVGRNYLALTEPFGKVSDARQYRADNYDELVSKLEKAKEIPRERRDINQPRVGEDMRGGADVSPELFGEAFGFRGVEFGNWVEQGRRQQDLNNAYDALMDMAAVLGISPKALSLNGELALAFGARGSGGVNPAAAHYEPGKVVINLTKMNGAGSLGHEWWHALDGYFSRMRGQPGEMMTEARDVALSAMGSQYIHRGSVRKEMVDAFGAVNRAIKQTSIKERSRKLDDKRSKDYWTTDRELSARAFESYLIAKLQDQNASNDYLANIVSETSWDAEAALGMRLDGSYPYPTAGEIPAIRAGFDSFFDAIQEREEGGKRVLFSKQGEVEGDKPAKHMTRKEAELVTKLWLWKYKGASGINVQIHATQADLEKALGLEPRDDMIRRAAFDGDTDSLHVAADTISDPKRLREVLRHEVLAHYGLNKVVGALEYIKLIARVINSRNDPKMRGVWDWVETHYADEDEAVQAEEVIAHLAEMEPSAWQRGWDRVVSWVMNALRVSGFITADKISPTEIRSLVESLGERMKRGADDGSAGLRGVRFSAKDDGALFKPDANAADEYRKQLAKAMASLRSGDIEIDVGRTPMVLQAVGAPDLTMRVNRDVVRKAINGVKHDVSMETIESLPELLSDPVAIFDSKTHPGDSLVVLLDAKDNSGRPVMTAIRLNVSGGKYLNINRVASVYGRPGADFGQWVAEGKAKYLKKLNHRGSLRAGLQLPFGSSMGGSGVTILTEDDVVNFAKRGTRFSQSKKGDAGKVADRMNQGARQLTGGEALNTVKRVWSFVNNQFKQARPLMLGTLTDLQISEVYNDIIGGSVSGYQALRTKMEADRNDILQDAETKIDPLWDALGKQEKADLSSVMHDATMTRLHPDKSLDENSFYLEAKKKRDGAKKPETRAEYQAEMDTIAANHAEIAKQYAALPQRSKDLYATMLDAYKSQWDALSEAIEERLKDMLGDSKGRVMAVEMRQKMDHALQHGPYFPLTRFGKYVVKARKDNDYIREHFEKREDAKRAVEQYQQDGYNAVMSVKEEKAGGGANAHQLGMEMLEFLEKHKEGGVSIDGLKDEIWQAMLKMLPDASYAKHAIHRRRVKGASRDAHRAYLNNVVHFARNISKIRYGHKMQAELDKLNEQIKATEDGDQSPIKPENAEIARQVLNEMNKRHEMNMNPQGKAWAGAAGSVGFLYYIGPSVASAVVNMTQNFTVMLPQLAAKYGYGKASKEMVRAVSEYARLGKFKAGTTEAWVSLTRSTTLPEHERALLEKLYRAGVLDLTQANSVAAKSDTDMRDVKVMGKRGRQAMRWAGALFHNAEVMNREVAALASYRLLKEAEPNLTAEQYADRVTKMVYDGHGNYASSNRPRYMRGDVAKVLTQFKMYSQMMTYVLYSNAIKAVKAGYLFAWKKKIRGKALTQDEVKAIAEGKFAMKVLGGVLGAHWVMAGAMGLPTPLTLAAYALAAYEDDDDDRSGEASFRLGLTDALGPLAGELLAKGPIDSLTGLSIANRTGIDSLWFKEPREGAEGEDLAFHWMQQLLGPTAGIAVNMIKAYSLGTDGHYQRAVEAALPKALKDLAKTFRQAQEGERTKGGDEIVSDLSAWNLVGQAIGFGSAEVARTHEAKKYINEKKQRIGEKRSLLLSDYFLARQSEDGDAVQEVLDRINSFNVTHHPSERITSKSLRLSYKAKLRGHERTQGGVHLSKSKDYLREEGRFLAKD